MCDTTPTPKIEDKKYFSSYVTGDRVGRAGDYWEVYDGCNGFDYIRTCGWSAPRLTEHQKKLVFGASGNIFSWSIDRINEKIDAVNKRKEKIFAKHLPIPRAIGWNGSVLLFED